MKLILLLIEWIVWKTHYLFKSLIFNILHVIILLYMNYFDVLLTGNTAFYGRNFSG